MFTGIIEGLGTLAAIQSAGRGRRLAIESDFAAGLFVLLIESGDSVALVVRDFQFFGNFFIQESFRQ